MIVRVENSHGHWTLEVIGKFGTIEQTRLDAVVGLALSQLDAFVLCGDTMSHRFHRWEADTDA